MNVIRRTVWLPTCVYSLWLYTCAVGYREKSRREVPGTALMPLSACGCTHIWAAAATSSRGYGPGVRPGTECIGCVLDTQGKPEVYRTPIRGTGNGDRSHRVGESEYVGYGNGVYRAPAPAPPVREGELAIGQPTGVDTEQDISCYGRSAAGNKGGVHEVMQAHERGNRQRGSGQRDGLQRCSRCRTQGCTQGCITHARAQQAEANWTMASHKSRGEATPNESVSLSVGGRGHMMPWSTR